MLRWTLTSVVLLYASIVDAEPRRLLNVPCKGCTLSLPKTSNLEQKLPLLVLLHGDEGNPSLVFSRWSHTAKERSYALLALQCPRNLGCTHGSWWRWAGDPLWLSQQVDEVAKITPLDRSKIFLVGWSGGASYMGLVSQQLRGFTGLSFNGGGIPPVEDTCAPCQPPVIFLVGDRNPLHSLAIKTRDSLKSCGALLEWSLLPGKDHSGELAALDFIHTNRLLDWLEQHAACGSNPPEIPSSSAATQPTSPPSPPSVQTTSSASPSSSPQATTVPRVTQSCHCAFLGQQHKEEDFTTIVFAVLCLGGFILRVDRKGASLF